MGILSVLDHRQDILLVLLDLSSAFDIVNHHILLRRLNRAFGISGMSLKWVESYITGRSQTIAIGPDQSKARPLSSDIPQGSVLGPLFLSAYISGLGTPTKDSHALYHH